MATPGWETLLAGLALAYLLGSIPFGLLLTKAAGLGDIRRVGSGNIGATNVLRTGRKGLALATLLLDGGKGALAVALARLWVGEDMALIAAAGSVLGHIFPVWLGFKGGKGIATALAVLLVLDWRLGALACLTWLLVAFALRYSSLASVLALGLAPVYALWLDGEKTAALAAFIAIVCIARHHANIRRLIAGTEPKIGRK